MSDERSSHAQPLCSALGYGTAYVVLITAMLESIQTLAQDVCGRGQHAGNRVGQRVWLLSRERQPLWPAPQQQGWRGQPGRDAQPHGTCVIYCASSCPVAQRFLCSFKVLLGWPWHLESAWSSAEACSSAMSCGLLHTCALTGRPDARAAPHTHPNWPGPAPSPGPGRGSGRQ